MRFDGQQRVMRLSGALLRSPAAKQVLTNRMRENFTYGSVGGAEGNLGSYPATGRLPRAQRQRRALASAGGTPDVSAIALLRLPQSAGPQLHPALHPPAFGAVAETRTAQLARTLWDSRWRGPLLGHARTGLFAWVDLNLWDNRFSYHRPSHQILKLIFAGVTRFLRKKPLTITQRAPVVCQCKEFNI